MSNILTIGYSVEGKTDQRFLGNVIQKTFEDVAFDCDGDIDVYPLVYIASNPSLGFVENTVSIAKKAHEMGIQVLCIHTDADSKNNNKVIQYKIDPAFNAATNIPNNICKNLVAIIPVRMSESWMLADTQLLKDEIGTTKSDHELGIAKNPETITDPKNIIEEALRIAQENLPRKLQKIKINSLYQPIGQGLSLVSLERLQSYCDFKQAVANSLKKLNYLR